MKRNLRDSPTLATVSKSHMRLAAQHRLRLSPAPHETRLVLSSHLAEPEAVLDPTLLAPTDHLPH